MKFCYQKAAYVEWTGSNLSEVESTYAASMGENFTFTVVGDELHVNRFGTPLVLNVGDVLVGTGWPTLCTAEEFASQYNPVP